jgi:hypothetical protein
MSIWRKSRQNSIRSKRKGLDGVILEVNEKHDVWTYQVTNQPNQTALQTTINLPTPPLQHEMDRTIYDVAVIGAGPAGLTLA